MKHPRITVNCTPELLDELLRIQALLRVSRKPGMGALHEFNSIVLQVMVARRTEPVLAPVRAAQRFDPPPIESHPDYCHEHGGHLHDSPSCMLAQARRG